MNNGNLPAKNRPHSPPISEETVNKMLTTQAKDQELKARELDIRQQELKAQAQFAHSMLEAQVADRGSERTHVAKVQGRRLIVVLIVLALVLAFLGYAMYLGQAPLVFEFAKMLVSALVGAFGGYGYKAQKESQKRQSEQEDA
jgi:hypothetical protein